MPTNRPRPHAAVPWILACAGLLGLGSVAAAQNLQDSGLDLPGVWAGEAAWADYDADGDADLLLIGETQQADLSCRRIAQILRNDGGLLVEDVAQTGRLLGVYFGDAAWADVDGDSDLDLAIAGWAEDGSESVTLYRSDDDTGSLLLTADAEAAQVLRGVRYADLAWADFDRDGDLDLTVTGMTAGGSSSTQVYRNDDGRLRLDELNSDAVLNVHNGELAWADYDNDGDLDLGLAGENVHSEGGIRRVTEFYVNEPTGILTLDAGLTAATPVSGGSLAWGDYDGDGNPDLAQSGRTESWGAVTQLFRNRPAGTLTADPAFALNTFLRVDGSLDWVDYDNDGDLDLAASGRTILSDRRAFVFENRDGVVSAVSAENGVEGLAGGAARWGDYDGDGRADLLLTGVDGDGVRRTVLYGNSVAAANRAPDPPVTLNPVTVTSRRVLFSWSSAQDLESPILTYNLRVGTEPGAGDILSATTPERFGNVGAKTSHALARALPPDTYYWSVQAVDGALARSEFASEGQFQVGQFVSSDQSLRGMMHAAMTWGDADGDGDDDLVLMGTNRSGVAQTLAYVNRAGDLTLDASAGLSGLTEGDIDWADVDGDGDLDLFVSGRIAEENRVAALYEVSVAGDDSLVFDASLTFEPPLDASASAWGDVDRDGDLDLVYGGQSAIVEAGVQRSYTRTWINDGAGSFVPRDDGVEGLNNGDLALGDLDGDGDLDLVQTGVSSAGLRRTDLYWNDAGDGFVDAVAGLPGLESSDLALGDYDRDGDDDLVLGGISAADGDVTRLYDNDGGVFTDSGVSLPGIRGGDLAWADYDNDQDLDLILAGNAGVAVLQVWENTIGQAAPDSAFERVDIGILAGVDFSAVAMADPDGDGDLDLVSSGRSALQAPTTTVNDNLTAQQTNANLAPSAPVALSAADSADVVDFSWGAGSDDGAPPVESLTYQLRVGTTPGGHDVVSGRRALAAGNAGHALGQRIEGLASGAYYWSVQTVDAGYAGSDFAAERTFIIDTIPPTVDSLIVNRSLVGLGQTVSLVLALGDAHTGIDAASVPEVSARIGSQSLPFTQLQFTGSTWTGELTIDSDAPSGPATISVRGIEDLKGNALTPFDSVGVFQVDAKRPAIVGVEPLPAATDVAAGDSTQIRIVFDEALDPATVVDQNFALRLADAILPVSASWDADALAVVLTPQAPLIPGSGYTVEASAGLADAAGNRAADVISWTFSTRIPRLLATTPAAGDSAVVVTDGRIEAVFDTPILRSVLDGTGAVQILREGTAVELREAPVFDDATSTLRFEPAEGLRPGSRYSVALAGLLGGPLRAASDSGAYGWSFATRVPGVTAVTPADGDTAVDVTLDAVTVAFDGPIDVAALDADGAVRLLAEGSPLELGSVSWDAEARTLSLTPAAGLRAGTGYRAEIGADLRGPLATTGAAWTFGTRVPVVVATSPSSRDAVDAGPRRVRVTFSSAVDAERIGPTNFRLSQAGRIVELAADEFFYDAGSFTVSLPEVDLVSGSEYGFTVLSRVGGPRATGADVDVAFTTRVPAVLSTTPAPGAEGIATGQAALQAALSGPIARRDGQGLSLRARSLDAVLAAGDAVPFEIVPVTGFGTDTTLTVVNFAPEGGLRPFTEYEVTLGADLFGDLADTEYSWRFSTAARLGDVAAGGTLTDAGRRVELYLPPNALSGGAEVQIAPLADAPAAGAGKAAGIRQTQIGTQVGRTWRIDAGDASLRKPATLTLRYAAEDLGDVDPARLGIFRLDGGTWTRVGGTATAAGGAVTTTVETFGTYALLEDLQTVAGAAAVRGLDCQPRAFAPAGGALRGQTDISFDLAVPSDVTVRVYNAAGRLERVVTRDQPMAPGRNSLAWDGRDEDDDVVASGLYIVVVTAGSAQAEKVVSVVR